MKSVFILELRTDFCTRIVVVYALFNSVVLGFPHLYKYLSSCRYFCRCSISVVLSVRGTLSATDVVADLWCADVPVPRETKEDSDDPSSDSSNTPSNGDTSSNNSSREDEGAEIGGTSRPPSESTSRDKDNLWAGEVAHAGVMAIAEELFAVIQETRVLFDLLDGGVKPSCCGQGNDDDDDGINWAAAKDYRLVRLSKSVNGALRQ